MVVDVALSVRLIVDSKWLSMPPLPRGRVAPAPDASVPVAWLVFNGPDGGSLVPEAALVDAPEADGILPFDIFPFLSLNEEKTDQSPRSG
ncbi:hypothetical protein [Burkholderia lata]|uniref:hypothetical protein n=1 Tax=Burkholderia lata (strain ATCC 17760 / DSM 23089 / LMG 22485 / NCIMB 9086 / R18194 / 383) TaxID=482957 RepID=UPI0020C6FA1E|nr:hypothetical protein [Burkholderia lata]